MFILREFVASLATTRPGVSAVTTHRIKMEVGSKQTTKCVNVLFKNEKDSVCHFRNIER